MTLQNIDIRQLVSDRQLHFKQIAAHMGIRADGLCRTMRLPLTPSMRERIIMAINELSQAGGKA